MYGNYIFMRNIVYFMKRASELPISWTGRATNITIQKMASSKTRVIYLHAKIGNDKLRGKHSSQYSICHAS